MITQRNGVIHHLQYEMELSLGRELTEKEIEFLLWLSKKITAAEPER